MPEDLERQLRETRFQLNQKVFQLETLYETGLSLGASLQIEEIVGEFLLLSVAMVDARAGFLLLRDENRRRLVLAQQANLDDNQQDLLLAEALGDRLKKAMRSDSTLHLDATALPPKLKSQHLMAIPVGDEGLLGVIDKETRQGFQAFTEADAHLLALTGQQAGTALANARLYRSIATCKSLVSM